MTDAALLSSSAPSTSSTGPATKINKLSPLISTVASMISTVASIVANGIVQITANISDEVFSVKYSLAQIYLHNALHLKWQNGLFFEKLKIPNHPSLPPCLIHQLSQAGKIHVD